MDRQTVMNQGKVARVGLVEHQEGVFTYITLKVRCVCIDGANSDGGDMEVAMMVVVALQGAVTEAGVGGACCSPGWHGVGDEANPVGSILFILGLERERQRERGRERGKNGHR
ncbi:hypothetical protein E2C01_058089 [Portunus trituberculatus]|uniref:Uncharacterized protein n=1 Tax=Portunus trituberculatus TaxID=210409 RepID=A0A5B7GV99_PORTR|nr:hypothetical protein [Portunus trituberculatus]